MDLGSLSDRVIVGVLENAITESYQIDDIKKSLSYLAVCQRWRSLGQSIIFKDVFIKEMGKWDRYLASNLYLVGNGMYTKKLSIVISSKDTSLVDILEPILVELNSRKPLIGWPTEDLRDHLLESTFKSSLYYNPQMLSRELTEVMSECLRNFATRFPNITQLHVKIAEDAIINGQFVSRLIEVYKDQLTELVCDMNGPLEISHFPKSLKKLNYTFPKWGSGAKIPIINSLTLKELTLNSLPNTWSWQHCCESSAFDNLESLSITTSTTKEMNPIDENTEMRVDMPCLKRLSIHNNSRSENHQLKFGNISQHIDKVYIKGNMDMLNEASKMSIKSIGWLSILLKDNEVPGDMSDFHKITNHLFQKSAWVSFESTKELDIDFALIKWNNLRELALNFENVNNILKILVKLPNLRQLLVDTLSHCNINKTLLKYLKYSKVREFEVCDVWADSFDLSLKMEEFVKEIRQHLPSAKCFFKITPYEKCFLSRRALKYRLEHLDYVVSPSLLTHLAFYYENEDNWESYL